MGKQIKVVELFAGVGGFRLGLDQASSKSIEYSTIWANQWEPSTKRQHAAEVYLKRFGSDSVAVEDIEKVIENDFDSIPNHDLLVGGFPCQDYSVASTLKTSRGIIGKKGVLFWSIYTILKRKAENAPDYIFLENVDRLLKSPVSQKGKDFAVMLASLSDLGYAIEWRVINAAEYGFPQRRRRVYLIGYKKGTRLYNELAQRTSDSSWITEAGVLASAFSVKNILLKESTFQLSGNLSEISTEFSANRPKFSPFMDSGFILGRSVYTAKTEAAYSNHYSTLGQVILKDKDVDGSFYIEAYNLAKWKYLKGAKKEERITSSGHKYHYAEGSMTFPDDINKPSRTIITSEGGSGPSRFKHVIKTDSGQYRRLTPIELERLNMFPDNHTSIEGISDSKRAFLMGNALVVGIVKQIAESLAHRL